MVSCEECGFALQLILTKAGDTISRIPVQTCAVKWSLSVRAASIIVTIVSKVFVFLGDFTWVAFVYIWWQKTIENGSVFNNKLTETELKKLLNYSRVCNFFLGRCPLLLEGYPSTKTIQHVKIKLLLSLTLSLSS